MKFSAVFDKTYSREEIFALMRILNGLSFVVYYLFVLFPNFADFFGTEGFIVPSAFENFPGSWLFSVWTQDTLKIGLFAITISLFISYTIGFYSRISQILLLFLQLGFHNANPFINHEPQQLNNLLLLLLVVCPIEEKWTLRKFTWPSFLPRYSGRQDIWILLLMQIYFGVYYFFAGLKKLPDPNWINGMAVAKLTGWDLLGRGNFLNTICQNKWVSGFLTYFTLIFEMGFLAVSFTRLKRFLIPVGLSFHLGISLSLDIGMFFWSMMMWYPLFLKREE
jgi:hypothetical protein